MLKFLMAPAACLILCGGAAAQDMPGLATLAPPDLIRPGSGASDPGSAAVGRPDGLAPAPHDTDVGIRRAIADLKTAPGPSRPWCAQDRRVGTGVGFCLIN